MILGPPLKMLRKFEKLFLIIKSYICAFFIFQIFQLMADLDSSCKSSHHMKGDLCSYPTECMHGFLTKKVCLSLYNWFFTALFFTFCKLPLAFTLEKIFLNRKKWPNNTQVKRALIVCLIQTCRLMFFLLFVTKGSCCYPNLAYLLGALRPVSIYLLSVSSP